MKKKIITLDNALVSCSAFSQKLRQDLTSIHPEITFSEHTIKRKGESKDFLIVKRKGCQDFPIPIRAIYEEVREGLDYEYVLFDFERLLHKYSK